MALLAARKTNGTKKKKKKKKEVQALIFVTPPFGRIKPAEF